MSEPGAWPPSPPPESGRRAIVRLDGQPVGYLVELPGRCTRFTYDAAWLAKPDAVAVSQTLPLRAEPYDAVGLHPFFENLLPEGWLLNVTTAALDIRPSDAFGLLRAACADCQGSVEIVATDGLPRATAEQP